MWIIVCINYRKPLIPAMDEGSYDILHLHAGSLPLLPILVVTGVILGSYYIFRKQTPTQAKRLPPGSLGLPLFGESISFLRAQKYDKTQQWFDLRIAKYGQIFKTSLFGKPTVVITGATGNKFIFTANENKIASNMPSTVSSILGKYNTFELTGSDHKLIRGAMISLLKPESLQRYLGEMDSLIQQQIFQELNEKDSVKAVSFFKRITFNVTCAVLFPIPNEKKLQDWLFKDFAVVVKGLWSLKLNFPMTPFSQAMAARGRICDYFCSLIRERRKKLQEGINYSEENAISKFVDLKDENGESISEDMIVDNMITLIIGSHDTTTILLSNLIRHLSRDKATYMSVLEEQETVFKEKEGKEKKLNWNDIQKMKYTWRVAQELMRITPPVFGNFKTAIKDTSFGSFDIPKGWQVFWVASGTHMDKNIFPNPDMFDPSRFETASKPYTYVPFGGGSHICPGNEFARMEVLLVIHHLITNYEWSEMIPNEPITRDPMPHPAMGLPIKLKSRRKHLHM